jgi:hypothetical protein
LTRRGAEPILYETLVKFMTTEIDVKEEKNA